MDDENAYRYEIKTTNGNPLTFVPPCNVTITSIYPVGGKVIINGKEQDSIPVDCKPGDSVVIKSSMVTSGVIVEPIEVQWIEHRDPNEEDEDLPELFPEEP